MRNNFSKFAALSFPSIWHLNTLVFILKAEIKMDEQA